MTPETLQKGTQIKIRLDRLKDIQTRLNLGDGFGQIKFIAHQNKTMFTEFEEHILSVDVVQAYKKFVTKEIQMLEKQFSEL